MKTATVADLRTNFARISRRIGAGEGLRGVPRTLKRKV